MTANLPQDALASDDPLMTVEEAAHYLSVPVATIYTWRTRRKGWGPRAVKFGGSLRYRRSDLNKWIHDHLEEEDLPADDAADDEKAS